MAFFNAWTTRGLNKGGESFKCRKIQYLALRHLDKVYATFIALSKETKRNTPLLQVTR